MPEAFQLKYLLAAPGVKLQDFIQRGIIPARLPPLPEQHRPLRIEDSLPLFLQSGGVPLFPGNRRENPAFQPGLAGIAGREVGQVKRPPHIAQDEAFLGEDAVLEHLCSQRLAFIRGVIGCGSAAPEFFRYLAVIFRGKCSASLPNRVHAQPHHVKVADLMELLDGPPGLGGVAESRGNQQSGVVVFFLTSSGGDEHVKHILSLRPHLSGSVDNASGKGIPEAFSQSYLPGKFLDIFRTAYF